MKLTFPSYDGEKKALVGHGRECVSLMIVAPDTGAGIVLTPDEAHALGVRLQQQAKASRRAAA
jgi:hypothetical protein